MNELKITKSCMSKPNTMLAYIVSSAYMKCLLNKLFSEDAIKYKREISLIQYNKYEEVVAPIFGSEAEYVDLSRLPDKQQQRLLKIGGDSPHAAMSSLYKSRNRLVFPAIKITKELEQFLFDATITYSKIKKRDRCWSGKTHLVSRNTYLRQERIAFDALKAVLRELSESFGLAVVPAAIAGESEEKRVLRKKRYAAWDAELRKRYFCAVADWLHEEDSANKQRLWMRITGRWFGAERDVFGEAKVYSILPRLKDYNVAWPSRELNFADSMNLGLGALKNVGKLIEVPKVDIRKEDICKMKSYLDRDAVGFCEYAMIDAAITAEGLTWAGVTFEDELKDGQLRFRMAAYTAAFFKKKFALIYDPERVSKSGYPIADDLRVYLGWEKTQAERPRTPQIETTVKPDSWAPLIRYAYEQDRFKSAGWWPTLQHADYSKFYYGGWNSTFKHGSFGKSIYWDQTSAYIVALMMLKFDYMYNYPLIFANEAAQQIADEMMLDGPGQIAGVVVSFEFHKTVTRGGVTRPVEPFFPVKIEPVDIATMFADAGETLLHPVSGYTYIPWPEYYAARTLDILKKCDIIRLETFAKLEGPSLFDSEISSLLKLRGTEGKKDVYKAILAYLYGKFSEGIKYTNIKMNGGEIKKKATPPGGLTNFPLASYCTSHCRAINGEVLNLNEPDTCLAITTDGYITTQESELILGEVGDNADKRLRLIPNAVKGLRPDGTPVTYQLFNASYVATQTLIIRTRCYIIDGVDEDGKVAVKVSRGGIQTHEAAPSKPEDVNEQAIEMLRALSVGGFRKESWIDFPKLAARGNVPPCRDETIARCSHSYDMKRIPILPVEDSVFEYAGETFKISKFNTRPLREKHEYIVARQAMLKNMTADEYIEFIRKNFPD